MLQSILVKTMLEFKFGINGKVILYHNEQFVGTAREYQIMATLFMLSIKKNKEKLV